MSEPFMQRFFKWCTIAVVDISQARILPVIHKYRYAPKNMLQVSSFLGALLPIWINTNNSESCFRGSSPLRGHSLAFQVRGEVCSTTSFTVISIVTSPLTYRPYLDFCIHIHSTFSLVNIVPIQFIHSDASVFLSSLPELFTLRMQHPSNRESLSLLALVGKVVVASFSYVLQISFDSNSREDSKGPVQWRWMRKGGSINFVSMSNLTLLPSLFNTGPFCSSSNQILHAWTILSESPSHASSL